LSSTSINVARIIPIPRINEAPHALIARFTGVGVVVGDLSGGSMNIQFNLPPIGSFYSGSSLLWDLQLVNWHFEVAVPVFTSFFISIQPLEHTMGVAGAQTAYYYSIAPLFQNQGWLDRSLPSDFPVKMGYGSLPNVQMNVSPNTNTSLMFMSIAGRMWDERFIED